MLVSYRGDLGKTKNFLMRNIDSIAFRILHSYGRRGVLALQSATPKETGKTASLWSYDVAKTTEGHELRFNNSNINKGENIAILIQYGHGTATGGYVPPTDYINPALESVFKRLADEIVRAINNG